MSKSARHNTRAGQNLYQYNGKELNQDLGLNWLDYGARWYNPSVGSWNAVDPSAEKYYGISPYAYTANNPLIYIDPTGAEIEYGANGTTYTGVDATLAFIELRQQANANSSSNTTEDPDPPNHSFAQVMFRGTATQGLAGFTGSVALGIVASYDDNDGFEYGVYVSGSLGVAAGTSGGALGLELGQGIGSLDDFGGWGLSFGGYSKWASLDATVPSGGDPEDVTITGGIYPSKQKSIGMAIFVEPTYTHFLIRPN